MKVIKIAATMAALFLLLAGCVEKKLAEEREHLVKIDDGMITIEDFDREFAQVRGNYGRGNPLEKEAALKLKAAFLNQMIEERLIVNEGRRLGLTIGSEEIDAAISEVRKDYADDKSFEKMLIKEYINFDNWRKKIETKLLIDKVVAHSLLSKVEVNLEEAEAYYNANIDKFKRDDQVRARQILVREEKDAVAARERILGGEDFASVAMDVSLSPDSQEGGDLGYFSRGVMPAEFDEVVFAMHAAEVSDVVSSPYGYHLFLLEDKKDARDISFDDARDDILKTIEREKMEEIYMTWIEDLKNRSKIEINRDALKRGIKLR